MGHLYDFLWGVIKDGTEDNIVYFGTGLFITFIIVTALYWIICLFLGYREYLKEKCELMNKKIINKIISEINKGIDEANKIESPINYKIFPVIESSVIIGNG